MCVCEFECFWFSIPLAKKKASNTLDTSKGENTRVGIKKTRENKRRKEYYYNGIIDGQLLEYTSYHKSRVSSMNPVYSPVQPGTPYGNPKTMTYTGYPAGYPTAAPAYTPSLYQTGSPGYPSGYTAGTPYKVPPSQSNGAPPPYSPSPNTYPSAMYPIRSAYPQQNLYTQGAYYTQPVYAAQPHVIHHTTVVQPNSIPSALYPTPMPSVTPRPSALTMGMVAGTTMAMSAGTLLTTPQHTPIGPHPVQVPTYRPQGTPGYSYVPPHW